MACLILLCLLASLASCTKEYSLDIRVEPPNSGSVNASPGGGDYEEGTEVILSPVPSSGYKFDAWSGSDASNINGNRIVMSKDMSITANFDLQRTISLITISMMRIGISMEGSSHLPPNTKSLTWHLGNIILC